MQLGQGGGADRALEPDRLPRRSFAGLVDRAMRERSRMDVSSARTAMPIRLDDVRTLWVQIDMSATKTSRLNLRVAPADDALLRQAADLLGETVSEFLVESARERAERLVADRTRFLLEESEWSAFCEALDRPPEMNPALRELFERPRPE